MAKEKEEFSFNELNKVMDKTSKFGGIMADGAGVSEITEYIPTGNYALNACLTGSLFKGIPNNRSICVSGESGVGKTYLILNMCREAQNQGYKIIFYDSENAVDINQVTNFGINPYEMRYEPVDTIQNFRTSVTNILDTLIEAKKAGKKIPKLFIALDSVGNLATAKEVEDAKSGSDKADMSRAKIIRSLFRIIMSKMGLIGASFVFSNHIYMTMDMFAQTVQSGGKGLVYGASIILNLSKAKLKEDGANQTGIIVTAKPDKNRFCRPITIKFHISYVHGMNPFVGLEEYISWDRCGIQRGKFITDKEFQKLKDKERTEYRECKDANGEIKYFQPSDSGRNICCDDGTQYPLRSLFTKAVFSDERLKRLDTLIKVEFSYPKGVTEEIEALLESDDEDEENLDNILLEENN